MKIILALVCGCLSSHLFAATDETPAYTLTTVADELNFPWSIAFLPDGRRLVTQLSGELLEISADGTVSPPISGVPEVFFAGQGGLFDVLPHPDFSNNQLVYLSYSAGSADANATTVARGRLTRAGLEDVSVIFSATPTKYAPLHYGGRLAWADSQHLLLTTGDGFDFREEAQDRGSHLGKTLRMRDDGTAPAQSPFPDHPYVWTYGHRNPQGLAVSRSGTVYQHEHGPRGGDEVNVLTPGTNYGWPVITYGMDYNGAYVSPFTAYQGMAQPAHVWVPSIAPSGLMVYEGSLFPAWQGDLFVGALVDNEVRRLEVEGDEIVAEQALFAELNRRIRDVRESPDGSIYIITDGPSGQIVRVTPGE